MTSGKTLKLIIFEVLEFTALVAPVFVVLERFASLLQVLNGGGRTTYWLIVAVSIAYVTTITLVAWVPLEYMVLKRRRFITEVTQWRPIILVYLILSTAPCFGILIASSKVQMDTDHRLDHFTELPVSLVLFSMIFVDILEKLRPYHLRGPSNDLDSDMLMPSPVLTHLQQVTTVSSQVSPVPLDHPEDIPNGVAYTEPEIRNGAPSGRRLNNTTVATPNRSTYSRSSSATYLYTSRPQACSGKLGILWKRDPRAEIFVESFLFWLDTVEMVRTGGDQRVFYSDWIFPVYILSFVSTLRLAITPNNPLLSWAGVAFQDFPFLVVRIGLLAVFGFVTPVMYLVKNLLVCLTYVYFTYLIKLKIFRRQTIFG